MTRAESLIAQHDVREALVALLHRIAEGGPMSKSTIRRASYVMGAEPEDVIAFLLREKPLPDTEAAQIRAWMKRAPK